MSQKSPTSSARSPSATDSVRGVDETLLARAAAVATAYRASLADRPVAAPVDIDRLRVDLGGELPASGASPAAVIDQLVAAVDPALVATAGPRFFGFVIGGSLPAATAADVLAVGWDQCSFNATLAPGEAVVEEIAGTWLKQLLGLPARATVGFVTGAQAANTVGLAVARHQVLDAAGWDVERQGLAGAPRVRLVAGAERHATIDRSLRLLGFGTAATDGVGADANGAMDTSELRRTLDSGPDGPLIVCAQAGNVNTGASDDLRAICDLTHERGGWVHVDGAFGMWAAANPRTRHLTDGMGLADSWACDGHKWLNVPYDSGFVFCAHPDAHAAAISYSAAYLSGSGTHTGQGDLALESSRRARSFAVWAALRELGRDGVAELVDRCCRHARRFAAGLAAGGAEIVNDVVLNQVLVGFGDGDRANARVDAIIDAVQRDGTCWLGGTTWRGRRLIRVAVSNWSTTEDDVDRSVAAILRCAAAD